MTKLFTPIIDLDTLKERIKDAKKNERHKNRAETEYWCTQWRQIALAFDQLIARMEQNTGMDIAMQKELVITLSDISPEGIRIMEPAKYPSIHIIPTAPTTKDDGLLARLETWLYQRYDREYDASHLPPGAFHDEAKELLEIMRPYLRQPAAPQPDLRKLIARMEEAAFNPTGDDRLGKFVPLDRCIALVKELV